ncbi:MAG: HD domain-containing protein [Nitrospirae bacterium]|nr:HD domain-containing protein [Nitrospirota bacterium]
MLRRQVLAVVDGSQERREQVSGLVSGGYTVTTARTSREAENAVRGHTFGVVLSDVSAPTVDSLGFLALYRDRNPLGRIIVLSRRPDFHSALQSLRLSAYEYLFDPVTADSLVAAVGRAFGDSERATARLRAQVAEENVRLKDELERANLETIMALAGALEARDEYTRGHSFRVSELAVRVGERMGLSQDEIRTLRYGGILHDIGKIAVDSRVLNKNGPLTREDYDIIYTHAEMGVKIISAVDSLKPVIPLIRYHHEAYEHLPTSIEERSRDFLLVCIIKVVDAYDAMVSDRPYRKALPPEMAVTELEHYSGSEFHPRAVETLERVIKGDFVKDLRTRGFANLIDGRGLAIGYL